MINYTPKFKVGDDCIVETFTSRTSLTRTLNDREFAKGKIIYVHPTHGWATYRALGYNMSLPNDQIMTVTEYQAMIAGKSSVKPLRV